MHPLDRRIAEMNRSNARFEQWAAESDKARAARWELLRQLRKSGRKPAFPVFITDSQRFLYNLESTGCFVLLHGVGAKMPAELLEGLDVRLHFFNCELGGRIKRFLDRKEVTPASLQVFCQCSGEYTMCCAPCDDGSDPWG